MQTVILKGEGDSERLWAILQGWKAKATSGKPLEVTVQTYHPKRSNAQSRRYFAGTVAQIAEQAWDDGKQYTPEVWHEYIKRKFVGIVDLPGGETAGASTTNLDPKQFAELITKVEEWASRVYHVVFVDVRY